MKVKIIENKTLEYNKKALHPLQSWEWGEARAKMGIEILHLGEYNQDKLINVYLLTFHKIPLTNLKIGYLPRSVIPSKSVLDFLHDYAKKNKIVFIKIEPYEQILNLKSNNLKKSIHPLFPEWTQIVDLDQPEEELLKKMHPKTRYNIRLAEKKGVVVREMSTDEGFKIFVKLYFDTCKRQKYYGHTRKYHQIIWDSLKKNIAHILIAYYKDIPLAAYELFYFADRFYYPYGGSSTEYRNLMATNFLMWEAIKLGKKLGAKKFDMWGSLPPKYDRNDPWSGFTKFKEGYGGKFVQIMSSYDFVINSSYYQIYNILYTLRQQYLKLKKVL